MGKGIILFFVLTLIVAACSIASQKSPQRSVTIPGEKTDDYAPPEYNPNKSITYNKPYADLQDELLYARITIGDGSTGHKTINLIKDKERLVQIVQGFDKLKSSMPQEDLFPLDPEKLTCYVVTIWREGTSVSYVITEYQSDFFYQESPDLGYRKIPEELLKFLGFK